MEDISVTGFSKIIEDGIAWSIESKENFFSIIVPVITLIATKKIGQVSFVWSLCLASNAFTWYRLYLNSQKVNNAKIKERQINVILQKYNFLASFLPLSYEQIQKDFQGFALSDKNEKINTEYHALRQKGILEACRILNLDPVQAENVWKGFQNLSDNDRYMAKCRMLLDLMPAEVKQIIAREKMEDEKKSK